MPQRSSEPAQLRSGLHVQLVDLDTPDPIRSEIAHPQGLSLSIVMAGDVDVGMDGRRFSIGTAGHHARAVFATIPKVVGVTRTPVQGERLIHVGLFAHPEWIEGSGLAGEADRVSGCGRAFGLHAWQPSCRMAWIARRMFSSPESDLDRLKLEIGSLELLAEAFSALGRPAALTAASPVAARKMRAVRERVEAAPAEPHSLESLAREFGMGVDTLHRTFRSVFGVHLFEHLRGYRLELARTMIEDGLPVSSAAYAVGYASPANFTTSFRRQFGFVPSAIRRGSRPLDDG